MKTPNDKKQPNPSTPSLGRLYRQRGNMVHVSKSFMRNPLAIQAELECKPFTGDQFLAFPGSTLNIGRNAAKRAAQARRLA